MDKKQTKKRIAFVGNLFHQKTGSSAFFIEILEKYFTIDFYWGYPRTGYAEIDKSALFGRPYDAIVMWQAKFAVDQLRNSRCQNIILIPMYDDVKDLPLEMWKRLSVYRFINFSAVLHHKLTALGAESLRVQFAPKTDARQRPANRNEGVKLFFWQRKNSITWDTIRQLIDPDQVRSVHIHAAVDPGKTFVRPTDEEIERFNITFSDWFESRDAYLEKVAACDIYVAPRKYEGIGMSFLEAMAMGKCVIAADCPTMNEYIRHGENGLLFNVAAPERLDLSQAASLGQSAFKSIEVLFQAWKASEESIADFIGAGKEQSAAGTAVQNRDAALLLAMDELSRIRFVLNPLKKIAAYKKVLRLYHAYPKIKPKPAPKQQQADENILIVFPHNPFLLQNGVQSRFYELLAYFNARGCNVDILSHEHFVDVWKPAHLNHPWVRHVYLNDFKKSKAADANLQAGSVLQNFAFKALKTQLETLTKKNGYDTVVMAYVHWAEIVKDIADVKKVIMIEDFISINNYERRGGKYNLGQSINEEIERINHFDKAVCISKDEMHFFERVCKNVSFYHVPHFLGSRFDMPLSKETDIVFVGSNNPFNKEGMVWFFDAVMPLLPPTYKIKIVGRVNEHLDAYKTRYRNVEFASYVDDIDEVYARSKISICPLQGGTGLKIKVVESLSYGVPVVATRFGIVGMDSRHNGCLVEDDPKAFAAAVDALMQNEKVYRRCVNEAKTYFQESFSKQSVYRKLDTIF